MLSLPYYIYYIQSEKKSNIRVDPYLVRKYIIVQCLSVQINKNNNNKNIFSFSLFKFYKTTKKHLTNLIIKLR